MKQSTIMILVATGVILLSAVSRVVFYPYNFSPEIAMALFSGAVIKDKRLVFIMPLMSMFLADVLFEVTGIAQGFWGWGQLVGYGTLMLIALLGTNLKKINVISVIGFSIASSLLFFFISNGSVWFLSPSYYARTFSGFMDCLAAGIPFLKNNIMADLVFSGVFFCGYAFLQKYAFNKSVA